MKYTIQNTDGFRGLQRGSEIEFGSPEEVNSAIKEGAILTLPPVESSIESDIFKDPVIRTRDT